MQNPGYTLQGREHDARSARGGTWLEQRSTGVKPGSTVHERRTARGQLRCSHEGHAVTCATAGAVSPISDL